jgi:hypothetical protein
VLYIELYAEYLAVVARIAKSHGYEIALAVDGAVIAKGQGPVASRVIDWTPEVDNLIALLYQLLCIVGNVSVDASPSRLGTLVNMYPGHWLPLVRRIVCLSRKVAADS